ncbi:RNA polymerase sigma factor [Actinoplanes sp. URMC 104]|uniref:RNA polymerase sigma factor n=1 Tax=Actinoplanes sp. URMC 104 TaxID=3423409 RepID=UPI003F1DC4A9
MTGVEAAFREHRGPLLATLVAELRSFDLAEEALQDALAAATAQWPAEGVPRRPAAWLLAVARRRAADRRRREQTLTRYLPLLITSEPVPAPPLPLARLAASGSRDGAGHDDSLELLFACCHPALGREAQVALTLRFVAGLSVPEIARLFLVPDATMAARVTRAKQKIRAAGIPLRVPAPADLPARAEAVLAVLYLLFTEGYRSFRDEVAGEAVRLGRLVRALLPADPEAAALLALMLLQHARRRARRRAGRLVLLADQDRTLWNAPEIAEALTLLAAPAPAGPYRLQALIAARHAVAARAADTDWPAIARLYERLEALTGSPVVRLNRAVAVAECEGPAAALELLDGLADLLPRNHHVPAARAEMLLRLGATEAAADAFDRALALAPTDTERDFLRERRGSVSGTGTG